MHWRPAIILICLTLVFANVAPVVTLVAVLVGAVLIGGLTLHSEISNGLRRPHG